MFRFFEGKRYFQKLSPNLLLFAGKDILEDIFNLGYIVLFSHIVFVWCVYVLFFVLPYKLNSKKVDLLFAYIDVITYVNLY